MGRVILCTGNTASIPYVLRKPDISIYTVEELCYCIKEHTILMDEEIVCRELIDWLREQCGLTGLADSLYGFLKTRGSVSAFLTTIMEYTGFYPKEEIRKAEQFLKAGSGLNEYERMKNVADYLAGTGKYELAMLRYQELLQRTGEEDTVLRAQILHNMGYVNGQLFLFDRAAEFFYRAYELSGKKESFLQFLAAKRMQLEEKEYVDFIVGQSEECCQMSMELEKRVEQVSEQWKGCRQAQTLEQIRREGLDFPQDYQGTLEGTAEQLKEKYRSMVR